MLFDRDHLIGQLRAGLASGPPLGLAILFGSAARGVGHRESDVDVGIVPRGPTLSWSEEADLQVGLARACGRPIDLVRLDQASTLLRWGAARSGGRLVAVQDAIDIAFHIAANEG